MSNTRLGIELRYINPEDVGIALYELRVSPERKDSHTYDIYEAIYNHLHVAVAEGLLPRISWRDNCFNRT